MNGAGETGYPCVEARNSLHLTFSTKINTDQRPQYQIWNSGTCKGKYFKT